VIFGGITVYGPASVSSACDDLKEKLNSVRISDLSKEIDSRIIILERAMSNVNHGQEIGFKMGGTVIDKKMMKLLATKLVAILTATLPVIIAVTVSMKDSSGSCEMTPTQQAALNAMVASFSTTCSIEYGTNVTIT
jgi:hypothetical protein